MKQHWTQPLSLKALSASTVALIIITILASFVTMSKCTCNIGAIILMVIYALLIIGICGVIIAISYNAFKKLRVKLVVFFTIFTYAIVLYTIYNQKTNFLDGTPALLAAINNTLSIFFPSRGSYEEIYKGAYSSAYIINFHFMHILAYLYAAMLALSFVGVRMMNRIRKYLPYSERYLFFGASKQAILLAKDIAKEQKTNVGLFMILPLSEKENIELFESLNSIGAVVLYRALDGSNIDEITSRTIQKTNRYFFLNEDEELNVKLALKIIDQFNELKMQLPSQKTLPHKSTKFYVKTESPRIDLIFQSHTASLHEFGIEVLLFNQSELTARQFIQKHHMLRCPDVKVKNLKVEGNFRLLILGFGRTGFEVMNKCICDSQFIGSTFSATIIDANIEAKHGEYAALYDECIEKYNLKFITDTVGSASFFQWMEQHITNYNRIIITLGNDRLNLDIATALSGIFLKRQIPNSEKYIFAHVREQEQFSYYKDGSSLITSFGDLKNIYSKEIMVNEEMDVIAKAVNYVYSQYKEPFIANLSSRTKEIEDEWNNRCKSIFNRDSSRAVALNIENIIELAQGEEALANIISDTEKLEILAENEHLRWNAFHFTKGIRKWNLNDIPNGHIRDAKWFKNNETKEMLLKHACLVKYSNLKDVTIRVNKNREMNNDTSKEDFQETDRRIIRHFPQFITFKIISDNEKKI